MVPRMASSVCWSALLCSFRAFCSFTREELMHIRKTTPADRFSTLLASSKELFSSKGVLTFVNAVKRQRGKRVSALSTGADAPSPVMFLSSV